MTGIPEEDLGCPGPQMHFLLVQGHFPGFYKGALAGQFELLS